MLYQLSYTRAPYDLSTELHPNLSDSKNLTLVEGAGFEPAYSLRTDLQSVAFNHSATPPNRTRDYADFLTDCQTHCGRDKWCRITESNC